MAHRQDWVRLIRALAPKYGVDPQAALAVASREGLSGGVGDNGHAFGPFQLNDAGGVITNRPGYHQAFAESPQGIEWALAQIGQVAKGLRGRQAVESIVRRFERPADPNSEVAGALGAYSQFGGGGVTPTAMPMRTLAGAQNPNTTPQKGIPFQVPQQVLAQVNASLAAPHSATVTNVSLPEFIGRVLQQQPVAPPHSRHTAGVPQDVPTPQGAPVDTSKWVVRSSSMDRQGVPTQPAVIDAVGKVAQVYGHPLTIGTGSNHNQYVVGTNHESDHWFGEAADIPMTGEALTRLGQSALIAAGADPKWARQQTGGVYNIGGYNILFNTHVGGNHYNHLHIGLGRILGRHFAT